MNILFSTNWSHLPCTGPVCPALLFGLTALPWKSCAFFGKKLLLLCMGEETDLLRLSNPCSKKKKKTSAILVGILLGKRLSEPLKRCLFPVLDARAFQAPWVSSFRSSCPLSSAASHLGASDRQTDRQTQDSHLVPTRSRVPGWQPRPPLPPGDGVPSASC